MKTLVNSRVLVGFQIRRLSSDFGKKMSALEQLDVDSE